MGLAARVNQTVVIDKIRTSERPPYPPTRSGTHGVLLKTAVGQDPL